MPNTVLKNRIRFARGTASQKKLCTDTLEYGVPFYDTTNKYLYIGKYTPTQVKDYTPDDSIVAANATITTDTEDDQQDPIPNDTVAFHIGTGSYKKTISDVANAKNLNDPTGTIAYGVTVAASTTPDITDNTYKVATNKFVHDVLETLFAEETHFTVVGSVTTNGDGSPASSSNYASISLTSAQVSNYNNYKCGLKLYYHIFVDDSIESIPMKYIISDTIIDKNNGLTESNTFYNYICISNIGTKQTSNNVNYIYQVIACIELKISGNTVTLGISDFKCLRDSQSAGANWVGGCTFHLDAVKLIKYEA